MRTNAKGPHARPRTRPFTDPARGCSGVPEEASPGASRFRAFMEGETRQVPSVPADQGRGHLGPLREWLPEGAMDHDPEAYLASRVMGQLPTTAAAAPAPA